ncbi:hypothetical protein SAMN04487943_102180 [Gracilibacillus orientalis]|uniref:Uncharacterized protein n=1 Tax=Gracilibacillus orientalis TaxID=334253 RepID=A0A1I4IN52_9BACI|nr:hypothetical protein SAMN04487943_102180 [Gracilibacillus orientalis]
MLFNISVRESYANGYNSLLLPSRVKKGITTKYELQTPAIPAQ